MSEIKTIEKLKRKEEIEHYLIETTVHYEQERRHAELIYSFTASSVMAGEILKGLVEQFAQEQELVTEQFSKLAENWYLETMHTSDYLEKILHPSYQRIIGLGKLAIPLILNELRAMPFEWFWSLRAITGEDPVKAEHIGQPEKMAQDWVEWGEKNKLI